MSVASCGQTESKSGSGLNCDHLDVDDEDSTDDFEPRPNRSLPIRFEIANGLLFFQAFDADAELVVWTYDGEHEPEVVADLHETGGTPARWQARFNGQYHFPGSREFDTKCV